jgi:hypothetical protein
MLPPRLRIDPFTVLAAVVFAGFLGYYGLCCFRYPWAADAQFYAAGLKQLFQDLVHPAHEAMKAPGSQSTVYTPYLVVAGALGRLTGLTPYRTLQVAGLANLVIYLCGIQYFMRRYSMHPHTALASAMFLLVSLFLRWDHFGWSSETSLLTMQFVQAYPSTIGWGMALFIFGLVEDLNRQRRPLRIAALVALLALLLLTHLITASWVIGTIGLRAIYLFARDRNWRFPVFLLAAIGAAVALATLWPYSPFLGQGSLTAVKVASLFGKTPFTDFANLYLVALPCAAWLLTRRRRHLFALIAFAAAFGALLLFRSLGINYGDRYSFFMAFWAHFLVAEAATAGVLALFNRLETAQPPPPTWLDRPAAVALLVAVAVACLPSPMWRLEGGRGVAPLLPPAVLWRMPSTHDLYYGQLAGLDRHLQRGDMVMMPVNRWTFDLAALTGAWVVSSPYAHRVPDYKSRDADILMFLAEGTTPATRLDILNRYCANKVVMAANFPGNAELERMFGEPIYRDVVVLFDAGPSLDPRCSAK